MKIRSISNVVNFCQFLLELSPFWNLKYWKYTVFRSFLLRALTYWAEILHISLLCCTIDQVWMSLISVNCCRRYTLFDLRILGIHSFPHFSSTYVDLLSWNFAYDFVLIYYRSSLSVVNFRQFLAHRSRRLEWAIVIADRPSFVRRLSSSVRPSGVNFSHFRLLL